MKKETERQRHLRTIKELREQFAESQKELLDVTLDRKKFRTEWLRMLRAQIDVNGRGNYYAPKTMIEELAKFLGTVERWYW